jgi:DNA-binding NtrC family response regulator
MKKKLLIIDDYAKMRESLQEYFKDERLSIFTADDGPQGLRVFRQQHPDVVLLDIGLPTLGGMDVLRAMRSIDKTARVILVTGFSSDEWRDRAKRNGAYAFHSKTSDVEELRKIVTKALGFETSEAFGPKA